MTFVSYAQNCEDVVLWRALRDVENGFYIDVGAADPVTYSVTKAFYERGWTGINIEPAAHYFDQLQADRPRDVNLRILAGSRAGLRKLHIVDDTGLSTISDEFARRHAENGFAVREVTLPELTLDQILEVHAGRPVHFLKIDVEGAEADVLSGINLKAVRPWIVVVEATEPLSQVPSYQSWEGLLIGNGYDFVYADGLNRFYVANEHLQLKEQLATPPNVFDNYVPFPTVQLKEQLAEQQTARSKDIAQLEATLAHAYDALRGEIERCRAGFAEDLGDVQRGLAAEQRGLEQAHQALGSEFAKCRDGLVEDLRKLRQDFAAAEAQRRYLLRRSFAERLLFQADGSPRKFLRALRPQKSQP